MNKIGWCDLTWNPVWGCKTKCSYCYAASMAKRFAKVIAEKEAKMFPRTREMRRVRVERSLLRFDPIFLDSHYFNPPFAKSRKQRRVFIGSMSEISQWDSSWVELVFETIEKYPQHIFQFLTKDPRVYDKYDFPKNCWLGWTITKDDDFFRYANKYGPEFGLGNNDENIFFASFEPLHGSINENIVRTFDWVIVGAETGNRKGKITPKFEWLDGIYTACGKFNIPIYMKDNLSGPFVDMQLVRQFPEIAKKEEF